MQHIFFLLLLLFDRNLSQEQNDDPVYDVDPVNRLGGNGTSSHTTAPNVTTSQEKNKTLTNTTTHEDVQRSARNPLRNQNAGECEIKREHKTTPLDILPGDSTHIWVSWKWDWFHYYTKPFYHPCEPGNTVIIVVD